MPVYEYSCRTCEHQFEELVLGSEKPTCPQCSSAELEKLLSAFAVGERSAAAPMQMPMPAPGGCGSCGDPRGPGACSMN